ncbi:type III secretion system inner membrane R protein [Anaeromyxobacter dehalogenans 2CP-1]|uniref:Type III secretion system inner membrane R protein n=1 Tax=Anaeromyxobacter dehalogenans (strain ATCC BAA-258 / DSM 21875 / 2CP-1) TaxID=455488 RepID=B8JD64_ANAD2|nr:flagellar biosynthetic protein FliR [Anaeromyxobacter dehalogenans]ACL64092.1 type III secretion system inner membrane R protein [Anaeromyxobacter dehalogenans 2CP-1]
MTELAPELLPRLAGALLHALRLAPVVMLSPLLGGPMAPPVARVGLALGLGGAAALAAGAPAAPAEAIAFAVAAAREAALGLALGLLSAAPVEAARAAGRLADTFRGATLSELHVAPVRQRESASGDLLAHWVVVLAAWGGGDRLVLRGLLASFATLPAGAPFPAGAAREVVLHASAELLAAAVAVAAPAAAGVLAADLALSLAARVAPQLGPVNVAQPARAALGLALLAAAASAGAGRLVSLAALPGQLVAVLSGGRP